MCDKKGYNPWNKGMKGYTNKGSFKKGIIPWIEGKHHSQATKEKLREIALESGHRPPSWGLHKKGYTNEGSFKKGRVPWNKGLTKETSSLVRQYVNKKRGKTVGNMIGKTHWNWKGGITPLKRQIREHVKYHQWRSDIFQRDNWICQTCGAHSETGKRVYLEVHHIKGFAKILKENKITNVKQALLCKELWDMNNGITLCKDCHLLIRKRG